MHYARDVAQGGSTWFDGEPCRHECMPCLDLLARALALLLT
jgi:hypothetical protein